MNQRFVVLIKIKVDNASLVEGTDYPSAWGLIDQIEWYADECCEGSGSVNDWGYLKNWHGDGEVFFVDFEQSDDDVWTEGDISDSIRSNQQGKPDEVKISWEVWPSVAAFKAAHVLDLMGAL